MMHEHLFQRFFMLKELNDEILKHYTTDNFGETKDHLEDTHCASKPSTSPRVDYILSNSPEQFAESEVLTYSQSDHKFVITRKFTKKDHRGVGYWKLKSLGSKAGYTRKKNKIYKKKKKKKTKTIFN